MIQATKWGAKAILTDKTAEYLELRKQMATNWAKIAAETTWKFAWTSIWYTSLANVRSRVTACSPRMALLTFERSTWSASGSCTSSQRAAARSRLPLSPLRPRLLRSRLDDTALQFDRFLVFQGHGSYHSGKGSSRHSFSRSVQRCSSMSIYHVTYIHRKAFLHVSRQQTLVSTTFSPSLPPSVFQEHGLSVSAPG